MSDKNNDDLTALEDLPPLEHVADDDVDQLLNPHAEDENDLADAIDEDHTNFTGQIEVSDDDLVKVNTESAQELPSNLKDLSTDNSDDTNDILLSDVSMEISTSALESSFHNESSFNFAPSDGDTFISNLDQIEVPSFPQELLEEQEPSVEYGFEDQASDAENVFEDSPEDDQEPSEFDLDLDVSENPTEMDFSQDFDETLQNQETEQSCENVTELFPDNETTNVSTYESVAKPEVPKENFSDIKSFARNMQYGPVEVGGNPPFSIILKNIQYIEDAEDIIIILRKHGLLDESNEEDYRTSISNGSLLISRISEYSAIYLAHRLRRFDLDIVVGLAEEIHPPKNYESNEKGLVSRENLFQNKSIEVNLEDSPESIEDIFVSTSPYLEGRQIRKYLGIATEHSLIEIKELEKIKYINENSVLSKEKSFENELSEIADTDGIDFSRYERELKDIYFDLTEKMRPQALRLKGNAIVGVHFQIQPIHLENPDSPFKITCTGNVVWVS